MPSFPRSQSAGAPPPLPPLPPSLTPGRHRGQSASNPPPNLFFEQRPNYDFSYRTNNVAPSSFYTPGLQRHTQSYTAGAIRKQPPLPPPPPHKPAELRQVQSSPPPVPPKYLEKMHSLPTLPPKISLYSQSIPGPVSNQWPSEKLPQVSSTSPPDPRPGPTSNQPPPENPPQDDTPVPDGGEDKDLETAMRLSEALAKQRKQEEEDLAKALEESRISAVQPASPAPSSIGVEVVEPDSVAHWDVGPSRPSHAQSLPVHMPTQSTDSNRTSTDRTLIEGNGSYSTSPQMLAAQLSDDEAFARRIAAGDEPESVDEHKSMSQESTPHNHVRQSLYPEAVSNILGSPDRLGSASATLSPDHMPSRPESIAEPSLSRNTSVRSSSSQQSAKSDPHLLLNPATSGSQRGSSPTPRPSTADPSSVPTAWPSAEMEKRALSVMTSQSLSMVKSKSTSLLTDGAPSIHANQFVEEELLFGVCKCTVGNPCRCTYVSHQLWVSHLRRSPPY